MINIAHRIDIPADVTDQINMLIQIHENSRITGIGFVVIVNDAAPITGAALGTRAAEVLVSYELGLLQHRLRTQAIAARAEQMMEAQAAQESEGAGIVGPDGRPLAKN